jgi:hypothetical protein
LPTQRAGVARHGRDAKKRGDGRLARSKTVLIGIDWGRTLLGFIGLFVIARSVATKPCRARCARLLRGVRNDALNERFYEF